MTKFSKVVVKGLPPDVLEERIAEWLRRNPRRELHLDDVFGQCLGVSFASDLNRVCVAKALRKLGWYRVIDRTSGTVVKTWRLPERTLAWSIVL